VKYYTADPGNSGDGRGCLKIKRFLGIYSDSNLPARSIMYIGINNTMIINNRSHITTDAVATRIQNK